MKKIFVLFFLTLIVPICCFSQTISKPTEIDSIVCVTTEQIKYANLIFIEHEKLLKDNCLLNKEINTLNSQIEVLDNICCIKDEQIKQYMTINKEQLDNIVKLQKDLKKQTTLKRNLMVGCFVLSVSVVAILFIK